MFNKRKKEIPPNFAALYQEINATSEQSNLSKAEIYARFDQAIIVPPNKKNERLQPTYSDFSLYYLAMEKGHQIAIQYLLTKFQMKNVFSLQLVLSGMQYRDKLRKHHLSAQQQESKDEINKSDQAANKILTSIHFVLQQGIYNINLPVNESTPLTLAIQLEDMEVIKLLLKMGATVDKSALLEAVTKSTASILKVLCHKENISVINYLDIPNIFYKINDIFETNAVLHNEMIDCLLDTPKEWQFEWGFSSCLLPILKLKNVPAAELYLNKALQRNLIKESDLINHIYENLSWYYKGADQIKLKNLLLKNKLYSSEYRDMEYILPEAIRDKNIEVLAVLSQCRYLSPDLQRAICTADFQIFSALQSHSKNFPRDISSWLNIAAQSNNMDVLYSVINTLISSENLADAKICQSLSSKLSEVCVILQSKQTPISSYEKIRAYAEMLNNSTLLYHQKVDAIQQIKNPAPEVLNSSLPCAPALNDDIELSIEGIPSSSNVTPPPTNPDYETRSSVVEQKAEIEAQEFKIAEEEYSDNEVKAVAIVAPIKIEIAETPASKLKNMIRKSDANQAQLVLAMQIRDKDDIATIQVSREVLLQNITKPASEEYKLAQLTLEKYSIQPHISEQSRQDIKDLLRQAEKLTQSAARLNQIELGEEVSQPKRVEPLSSLPVANIHDGRRSSHMNGPCLWRRKQNHAIKSNSVSHANNKTVSI